MHISLFFPYFLKFVHIYVSLLLPGTNLYPKAVLQNSTREPNVCSFTCQPSNFRKRGKLQKILKRGTFLNFLYITIHRFLHKEGHMVKLFFFFLSPPPFLASKRGMSLLQVCSLNYFLSGYRLIQKSVPINISGKS